MKPDEIGKLYGKNGEGRDEALEAYRAIIAENPGEDALSRLAFLAADFAHGEALSLLFDAGVPPAVTAAHDFTLLHILARRQESHYHQKPEGAVSAATKLLLDNRVSALRKDTSENLCCYHYAAREGNAEMVEALAERGVKLNMTDKNGNTGIHIACEYVKHALSDIAYKKKDVERARAEYEKTVAQQKANNMTDEEIADYVKKWITNPPEKAERNYDAALKRAEDYFRVVKAFASGGVDIDEKNEYGISALDIAVESGAKKIAAFLSGTFTEGGDEAAIDAGGMTLHQAAEKCDITAIKAIAATGADLNGLKDDKPYLLGGCTPLAVAVACLNVEAAEALLEAGADPSFKDGNGNAAIFYLFSPHFKGNYNVKTIEEKYIPRLIKAMLGAGFKIDETVDDDGNTLLLLACKASHSGLSNNHSKKGDVIEEALKNSPDINLRNRFGETALMHASSQDFEIMENIQIALLEDGADTAAADKNGDTALHYAARNRDKTGAKNLCDMLLEFGADAKTVNNEGKTALDIATEEDNEPLVKLSLNKM
jgi:ankyrin repeat protein